MGKECEKEKQNKFHQKNKILENKFNKNVRLVF